MYAWPCRCVNSALSFRLRRAWEKTMSFAVKVIDHVEVFVGDLEVAAKWYEDVLGLTEITRWDPEPLMIGAGATKLALFRRNSARAPSAGPLRTQRRLATGGLANRQGGV